ncbi:MAG: hypothetical protein EXS36_20430 [Pedosphaera sp.]|nr:hypothetical protein [Pedosphaera sp.]
MAAQSISVGTHQLRLTITDSAGLTNTATVRVQIAGAAAPRLSLVGYDPVEGVLQLQVTPTETSTANLQVSEDLIRWTTIVSNLPSGIARQLRLTNSPSVPFRAYRVVSP